MIPQKETLIKVLSALTFLLFISSIIGAIYSYKVFNSEADLIFTGEQPEENQIFKKYVYLQGEIQKPGVYEFKEGERLFELIERAGGLTNNADPESYEKLNPSKLLSDEENVTIASQRTEVRGESTQDTSLKININTASKSELESLPGVGSATAEKIIQNRPYSSIEELLDVSGIGDTKYSALKDLVTVD